MGLYGILGNGTNNYALSPILNEEFAYLRAQNEEEDLKFGFRKIDAASEYTSAVLEDGQIFVWGKNDWG